MLTAISCALLCVQVTRQLAALYVQAMQQHPVQAHVLDMACMALVAWLGLAMPAIKASPTSRAVAALREQLQDSQLLQHLGPAMDAAAAQLGLSVGTLTTLAATPDSSPQLAEIAQVVDTTETCCGSLLHSFHMVSSVLATTAGPLVCTAAWPAAPSAVRLNLQAVQTRSQLQTLRQQQPFGALFATIETHPGNGALEAVFRSLMALVFDVANIKPAVLQSRPGAGELLLSPEFVSCLAIALLVVVLALDTSGTVAPTVSSSSSSSGSSSSGHRSSHTGRQRQQQSLHQTGSSSSSSGGSSSTSSGGSSSNSSRNGVRPDSLTPLSCSLFGVLGVTREAALQAAEFVKSMGIATTRGLSTWVTAYRIVVQHQVSCVDGLRVSGFWGVG